MSVTGEGFSSDFIFDFFEKLRNQPIYQLLIVYIIAFSVIIFNDTELFNWYPLLFFIVLFIPLLPAVYAEEKWKTIKYDTKMVTHYQQFEALRIEFLLFGGYFSIVFSLISKLHEMLIGNIVLSNIYFPKYTETVFPRYAFSFITPHFYLYFVVFAIFSLPFCYKLLLLGTDSRDNSKYNRFFSHPMLQYSLLSYFLAGTFFVFIILFPFQGVNSLVDNGGFVGYDKFLIFNLYNFGRTLQLQVIVPLFLVITVLTHMQYMPYFLEGKELILGQFQRFRDWFLKIFVITAISGFVLLQSYSLEIGENRITYLIFGLIAGVIYLIYLLMNSTYIFPVCTSCGFVSDEKCVFCEDKTNGNNISLRKRFKVFNKISIPKCPSCSREWDNLSRRCTYCQYTIVLTCDNCSQTINPLWRKCNLCGEPRKPVPDIALSIQEGNQYALVRARYIVVILLSFPIFLVQTLYLSSLAPQYVGTVFVYDDIKRILLWIVFLIFSLLIIYRTSNRDRQSVMLVLDPFVRFTYSELFIFMLLQYLLAIPYIYYNFQIFFFWALLPILIMTIVVILFRRYKDLKSYDPPTIRIGENQFF